MIRNLAALGFFAGAYASNPDEESFQRFVESELKKDGSNWVERKIVAQLSKNIYQRENYQLFSLVRIPEEKVVYLGLFANWIRLPPVFLQKADFTSPGKE